MNVILKHPILIVLKGNPKSTNHIYKIVCRGRFPSLYLSKQGKDLKEDYQWQIKQQYRGIVLTSKLSIHIRTYHGTKRKSDWDNFHKLSMDSLTGIVYEDDSQIVRATVEKFYDKDNPRIEIELSTV